MVTGNGEPLNQHSRYGHTRMTILGIHDVHHVYLVSYVQHAALGYQSSRYTVGSNSDISDDRCVYRNRHFGQRRTWKSNGERLALTNTRTK